MFIPCFLTLGVGVQFVVCLCFGSLFIGNVNRCEHPKQYKKTVEAGGNSGLVA